MVTVEHQQQYVLDNSCENTHAATAAATKAAAAAIATATVAATGTTDSVYSEISAAFSLRLLDSQSFSLQESHPC